MNGQKILQGKIQNKKADLLVIAMMTVIVIMTLVMNRWFPVEYIMYTSESSTYERGVVTRILAEELSQEEGSNRYRGVQTLKVAMKSGSLKGQEIEVKNELSATHNIATGVGQRLIIKVDAPEGLEPYYTVFNYDRTVGISMILVMFAVFMILVGGRKGVKSMIGLCFALFLIIDFLLPAVYHGWSPIGMGIICAFLIAVFSMLLLNGFSEKTFTAITATMAGVILAAVFYYIFSVILHLGGFNLEEAEELIIVQGATGLKVGQTLFTGILIASLGAVMDMTMSVASALFEMKEIHPEMYMTEVFRSGISIGQDMIGTMCETLILAFAGSSITALLVMIAYGAQFNQILSSDYVAIELIHSLTGSMAVILSVPITAGLSAFFTCNRQHCK